MSEQQYVSATIYAKHGDANQPEGRVGITFPPTPSLSYVELLHLIRQLSQVERRMRKAK
jgi:hypothetical protein